MNLQRLKKSLCVAISLMVAGAPAAQLRAVMSSHELMASCDPTSDTLSRPSWNWDGMMPNKAIQRDDVQRLNSATDHESAHRAGQSKTHDTSEDHMSSALSQVKKFIKLSDLEWTRIQQRLDADSRQYRFISAYQLKQVERDDPELPNTQEAIIKSFEKIKQHDQSMLDRLLTFVSGHPSGTLSPTALRELRKHLFQDNPTIETVLSVHDHISSVSSEQRSCIDPSLWNVLDNAIAMMAKDDWETLSHAVGQWALVINWSEGLQKVCQIHLDETGRKCIAMANITRHFIHLDRQMHHKETNKFTEINQKTQEQYTQKINDLQKKHHHVYWDIMKQCIEIGLLSNGMKDHFHHYLLKNAQYSEVFEQAQMWGLYTFYFNNVEGIKCRKKHSIDDQGAIQNMVTALLQTMAKTIDEDNVQMLCYEIDDPVWKALVPWVSVLLQNLGQSDQ